MLQTQLTKTLLHTTDNYINSIKKWWLETIENMLLFFPRDYEDRSNVLESFSFIDVKEKNTIILKLISIDTQKTANWKILTKAVVEDKNGFMSECIWFNKKFLQTQLQRYIQKQIIVNWKVKYEFWKLSFISPEIETDLNKSLQEIVPIYSDVNYIPGSWITSKITYLKDYCKYFSETLPESIIKKYNFMPKSEAIYKIHFPKNKQELDEAKYRLAYEELYEVNYKSISKKHENFKLSSWKSLWIPLNADFIKQIISKLPFELTNHQKISLFQILKDMEKTHSMQRLLEWDVWTWKTIIAAISAIHTIIQARKIYSSPLREGDKELSSLSGEGLRVRTENDMRTFQVVIMAPTEILARQHFEWLYDMFSLYWISCELLVWSTTKKQKEIIKDKLVSWDIDVIIWTHALIQDDVYFKNLVYVIIDEQHRFWVRQREALEKYISKTKIPLAPFIKGEENQNHIDSFIKDEENQKSLDTIIKDNENQSSLFIDDKKEKENQNSNFIKTEQFDTHFFPHSLNMTATPIPRTLALTLYGDQDLSIINEYPKNRKTIFTKVIKNDVERQQVELFIRNQLESWRQVFWISPLVEESEKIDLANAISTYESLVEIFSPFSVWLLHWKMKPREKDEIMKAFSENKIQILSSTSVVEVWVNIPNASIMCIEWAERFGLSQLHQFRWRVWRWAYQSYCYLFPSSWNSTDRLKAMEKTNNWFELAEIDLEIRWPWEVYWVRQSWVPEFKIASLTDLELISQIREDIEDLFKNNI